MSEILNLPFGVDKKFVRISNKAEVGTNHVALIDSITGDTKAFYIANLGGKAALIEELNKAIETNDSNSETKGADMGILRRDKTTVIIYGGSESFGSLNEEKKKKGENRRVTLEVLSTKYPEEKFEIRKVD